MNEIERARLEMIAKILQRYIEKGSVGRCYGREKLKEDQRRVQIIKQKLQNNE